MNIADVRTHMLSARRELDKALNIANAATLGWRDIRDELATNPGPYTSSWLQRDNGWWQRSLDDIDAITFHHTLSDSPHATASHYVNKDGGRPTIPYTIWVTQTGEALLCVSLTEGLWHDHTGHENTHLSIGLAGQLHLYHPADAQLDAAANTAAAVIKSEVFPKIKTTKDVYGHMDWIATACPGWNRDASGNWKPELYARIREELE